MIELIIVLIILIYVISKYKIDFTIKTKNNDIHITNKGITIKENKKGCKK